ncbi:MAG TPA: site-specific DNA-methyltransferase [Fimbriimonadaceae bacterium]|nr:site-specific DNA-methyltransferase [Fimbriimonadaceae bacterium]
MPRKSKDEQPEIKSNVFSKEEATRKNIPEAGMVDYEPKGQSKSKTYCWDPRESPQLIWAGKAGMNRVEVEEQTSLEVPTVNLHIHERVSPEAIIRSLKREDVQRSLFADPVMEFKEEVKFYQHDVNWSNRMILGDSLLVMNSLLEREGMRGSVQCIYMDPPYGIKFGSNFQPRIDKRDVKDGADDDLSREVEVVQAFRDTWELGIHSYLSYMRDRLIVARELLKDEGSIFVQIGDENVHRVRCLMDEVFGEENFCGQILFRKTGGLKSDGLAAVGDYILWFAKNRDSRKYHQLYLKKQPGAAGATQFRFLLSDDRKLVEVKHGELLEMAANATLVSHDNLTSQGNPRVEFSFEGRTFVNTYKPSPQNMLTLARAGRVIALGNTLRYIRKLTDYEYFEVNELWDDTGISGFGDEKRYIVYTSTDVIQRCILMTTDPGDLVLDPTCGSGTTAYVAEQWGRRWITCDTSRVALAIARHRLMTASFDFYKLRFPAAGISGGFKYKTVPHITLKSIAQNKEIDDIYTRWQPLIEHCFNVMNEKTGYGWREWEVPRSESEVLKHTYLHYDTLTVDELVPKTTWTLEQLQGELATYDAGSEPHIAHLHFWALKRAMQAEIDASIQKNAPQEELVDQPDKDANIVRVAGPFTMEAIPDTAEISMEVEHIPADDEPMGGLPGLDVTLFNAAEQQDAANASAYIADMIEKLRKAGVHARGKGKFEFTSLRPMSHDVLHAEGEIVIKNGVERQLRCAVLFGAQNGAISETHVREGMRAGRRYDAVLFCGYDFTATAQDMVNEHRDKDWLLMMSYISPDTAMGDLLKDTKAAQLFTLVGEPDVVVYAFGDPHLKELAADASARNVKDVAARLASLREGEVFVELRGVDLYNPVTGETSSDHGSGVHAIFIDHDYDGKSFCICQALFPNKKDSWEKIGRALKGSLDEDALEAMRSHVSLPFKVGPEGRIQVKVIDARGNSVVKTVRLNAI